MVSLMTILIRFEVKFILLEDSTYLKKNMDLFQLI